MHFLRIPIIVALHSIAAYAFGENLQKPIEISAEKGKAHLEITLMRYPYLIKDFDKCRENDKVGHPPLMDCQSYGFFSPETLQYIKIAGDLKSYFGNLNNLDVVEIGGSCGGLCKILHVLGGVKSYTIINQAETNQLTKKYLQQLGVISKEPRSLAISGAPKPWEMIEIKLSNIANITRPMVIGSQELLHMWKCELSGFFGYANVTFVDIQKVNPTLPCDLLISTGCFSELDINSQKQLLTNLILKAPNGYLVCPSVSPNDRITNKGLIQSLYHARKKGVMEDEIPQNCAENKEIIKWRTLEKCNIYTEKSKDFQDSENFVTYSFSGGRFGDNLIAYLHAKWISYEYNLPLLFVPFQYSDILQCHNKESRQEQIESIRDKESITIYSNRHFFEIFNDRAKILCLAYYPECFSEYIHSNDPNKYPYFFIDWEEPEFLSEIRDALKPVSPPETFEIPDHKISLAVHVRNGGGFDPSNVHLIHPLKLPDENYYIEQIKTIHEILNKAPLFVHIFTDHQNPSEIVDSYSKHFQNENIEFSCRKANNSHDANVVEDFFMLTKFDCLIRTSSNYSFVASKLADYKIIISPTQCAAKDGRYVVNKVCIEFNPNAKKLRPIVEREEPNGQ